MFTVRCTQLTILVVWLLNAVISSQQQEHVVSVQKCQDFLDSRSIQNGENLINIPYSRTSQAGYSLVDTLKDPLTLRLVEKSGLKCPIEKAVEIQLRWNLSQPEISDLKPRNFQDVMTGSTDRHQHSHFTHSGYFYDAQTGNYYTFNGGYCVSRISNDAIGLRICAASSECTDTTTTNTYCLPKCCALDETLSFWNKQCVRVNKSSGVTPWQPLIFQGSHNPHMEVNLQPNIVYHMSQLPQNCNLIIENDTIIELGYRHLLSSDVLHFNDSNISQEKDNIKIVLPGKYNGKLEILTFYQGKRKWKVEHLNNFCVEQFQVNTEESAGLDDNPNNFIVIYCPYEEDVECEGFESEIISWVYVAISLIALVFLLATIIVYAVLWDKLNFHGVTIASYTVSTFWCFFFLMIAHLISLYPDEEWTGLHDRGSFCYTVGILAHYFYFSSLLWLTCMNFDIWITFKRIQAVRKNTKEWSKYGVYSIVSWLFPGILVTIFVVIDHLYRDPFTEIPVPDYAMGTCFVSREFRGQYLYIPMAILLMINILLILMTMWIFIKTKFQTSKMLANGRTINANRYNVALFVKLFVVMGGTSIIEFLTWYYNNKCHKPWYIVVFEVIENISPVILFFLFCLNGKVVKQMKEKYPIFSARIQPLLKICKKNKETAAEHSTGSTNRSKLP